MQGADSISIEYDRIDRLLAMEVLKIAEDALPEISRFIGDEYSRNIHIKLISDMEEFERLTRAGLPDWGVGFADAKNSLIIICSPRVARKNLDIKSITRHELAHIILGGAADGKRLPRWFNEGVAMYCSNEWRFGREKILAIANFTNTLIPLSLIDYTFPRDRNKAEIAYTESFSAIAYIIQNFGLDGLRDITKNLRYKNFEDAFFASLGITYDEFTDEWEKWARKTYNFAYFINNFLWLAIVLIFLVIGIISLMSRKRKLAEIEKSTLENSNR